jgi:hypothetical protein
MVHAKETAAILLFAILAGSFTMPVHGDSYGTKMNVRDEPMNSLWWMKSSKPSGNGPELDYASKLQTLLHNDSRSDLRAVYGNCFVNPSNATLFIVLTRCDNETIALFNEALNPTPAVHLVYRVGPATYEELERYMGKLRVIISGLRRDVVEINSYGITENATLIIGMGKINETSVKTFAEAIRGSIPEELIVIRHDDPAQITTLVEKTSVNESIGPIAADSTPKMYQPIDALITLTAILLPLLLLTAARRQLR